MDRHLNGRQNMGPPPIQYAAYPATSSQTQGIPYYYNQQTVVQRPGGMTQTQPGAPAPSQSGVPGVISSYYYSPQPIVQRPGAMPQNPGMSAPTQNPMTPVLQPAYFAYNIPTMIPRTNVVNAQPPSGTPAPPPAPVPNMATMASNQSQPQNTGQNQPKRRKNALKIIDPNTGADRLDEIFVENSHSTSGDSSARQTPQPNPSHSKEVQATFAKQVMQAISKDLESTHIDEDQHHHPEEQMDPSQGYHIQHGVPCTKVDPIVQSSKLQPGAKEFMSKEPPIVSANCDAEEVTLTNKLPKERESPVKGRSKRDYSNRDQKDPIKETSVTKDSDKPVVLKPETSSQSCPTNASQPIVNSRDSFKDSNSHVQEKKGQRKEHTNTPDPKTVNPDAHETSSLTISQQQTYPVNQDVNSNTKPKQSAARSTNPKSNPPPSTNPKPAPQIPTPQPQPVKSSNKSHKKSELNQKGASKEGTDMDAFNDNTVTEENANVNISPAVNNDVINANVIATADTITSAQPSVKDSGDSVTVPSNDMTIKMEPVKSMKMKIDITDIVKEKPIVMKPFLPVESQDETDRAALSNDKVVKAKNEANAKGSDNGSNFKLPYQEGQWTPWDQTGSKVYSREFLLAVKDIPASRKKPDNIPDVVLADERGMLSDGRLSMGGRNDFLNPPFNSFGGKSGSQRGSMPTKRNSQSKMDNKKSSKPSVKLTISLKEDVKLHEVENAWRPARFLKGEAASDEDKKTEELYRRVRGVLNKLTPQKFDTLLSQIKGLKIDTAERLQGVIDLVFEKAVDEPNFSVAYALMCRELALMQVPTSNCTPEKPDYVNFRKLLLTRCQMEFEKQSVDESFRNEKLKEIEACPDPEKKKDLQFELEDYDRKLRKKSVGNIRFIGELFKQNMLTVNIMLRCLNNLIDNKDEESLECLCKLLTTIGKELESKNHVNLIPIFNTMKNIADKKEGKVSSRIRFMLQDVIDLRNSKWIPRRQDHNPKTIDQIQKEADQEQMNIQIMNSVPATPRKDDRSNSNTLDRKGGRGRNSSSDAEGWITNTNRSRPNQFTVQSDKLKMKAPLSDEPFGTPTMFLSWNRGSIGSTMKSQSQPLGPNIYAALDNIEPEKRSLGVSRPSANKDPYIPKGPSLERYKFDGRGSRSGSQHRSMEGPSESMSIQRSAAPPAPAPVPTIPPPQKSVVMEELSEEQMERRINNCLDEYISGNCTIDEFFLDISTFVPLPKYPMMINDCYLKVLEKSSQARLKTGLLFAKLVNQGKISLDDYCLGLEEIFGQADDLKIDIPKIWDYLAEVLVEALCEEALPLSRLHKSIAVLVEQQQATKILAPLFKLVVSKKGPNFLQNIFKTSGLQLTDFMNSAEVDPFVQGNHFEFLVGGATQIGHSQMTFEQIEAKLSEFFKNKANFDDIVNWITANVGDRVKENKFIRALATAIFRDSVGPNYKLVQETLTHHNNLLLKYVDNNPKYELECLYALQALVNKMEHPQGLLLQICDKLYELGSFSQESFIAWENSKDPAEQAGKGVALKQLTSFFTQLKENDDDESSGSEIA